MTPYKPGNGLTDYPSMNIFTFLDGSIAVPILDGITNPSSFQNSSLLGDFHITRSI
jgi:hypothetical protein